MQLRNRPGTPPRPSRLGAFGRWRARRDIRRGMRPDVPSRRSFRRPGAGSVARWRRRRDLRADRRTIRRSGPGAVAAWRARRAARANAQAPVMARPGWRIRRRARSAGRAAARERRPQRPSLSMRMAARRTAAAATLHKPVRPTMGERIAARREAPVSPKAPLFRSTRDRAMGIAAALLVLGLMGGFAVMLGRGSGVVAANVGPQPSLILPSEGEAFFGTPLAVG